ncbi:DNA/RNA non-specific endonuclease [Virgisporangium aurantiacum]|uniref:Serine protease n=1 Tax=Virgisporangium aurantiacum TaxID=175570 RepID=A0A8J4E6A4_9ACTN|nr:DNA/RNA non-specific endonuclease [Virgisporangium aurantiacum]GIJ63865.1 endonuclease [Virgisporangium aurantiacum]
MDVSETGLGGQLAATAARVAERTPQRSAQIAVLRQPGGMARADEPDRVATRIDRLSRFHPDVRPVSPAAIAVGDPAAIAAAGAILERIIQTDDLLGVGYLDGGVAAARAVGRVNIRDERGRLAGYGTGFLVAAGLLLTNHHVLPDARVARFSSVEFDYQDGPDGRALPLQGFRLDPGRLFLADKNLDFALVAVAATPSALARFGFNRLLGAEGKAIVGDFVTIVQHPGGEKKQIAIRENRIVDLVDEFVHYETDTEPGSSGSPVFNDQWEVVALHHAAVPTPNSDELGGMINEGVRVSRLLAHLRGLRLPPAQQALLDAVLGEDTGMPTPPSQPAATGDRSHVVTITVPANSQLRIESAGHEPAPAAPEAIRIDPDYTTRDGYDPDFLGDSHRVPLPVLSTDLVPLAAINRAATTDPGYLLPYHHFTIVQHRQRRLAIYTAVNIDGATSARIRRDPDRWILDPRVPADQQAGEEVYADNPLDRGHLVRRLDPAWGRTPAVAKAGNDDTFHFTNCTPQHKDFNQNQTTWAGLEDYILEHADNRDLKVTVFTGPVLAADDQPYRGIQLPRQFWKIVVMVKTDGALSATGYLLSQETLIRGLELEPEAFSYGAYKTYQVPIPHIEALTRLSFGTLTDADPLTRLEATRTNEITDPRQLIL